MIGKRALYSGRVQGVGFRYTALGLAQDFPVSGYVRNLPGGQVELVAEGAAEDVDAFLDAVARKMAGHIENQSIQELAPAGCRGFTIRH